MALALSAAAYGPLDASAAAKSELGPFRDTFEALDRDRWSVSDGWSNGSVFNVGWKKDQVRAEEGRVLLGLADVPSSDRPFSAGELQSRGWGGYGSYEIVMRAADGGPGMVSGFFVYTGPYHGDTHEEIDFEWLGKDTSQVQVNYYSDGKDIGGELIDLGFDAAEDHNVYRFDWLPDRIDWYVNGELVHSEDGSRLRLPKPPAKIFAHIWTGAGRGVERWLGGKFVHPQRPVTASIECISYVPMGTEGETCSTID